MSSDLVTLITTQTEFEANILAIVLKDHGVEAFVFASPSSGMGVSLSGGTVGVPLQVREEDVVLAKQILSDNRRDSIDIDWEELGLQGSTVQDCCDHKPVTMKLPAKIACTITAIVLLSGLVLYALSAIYHLLN
ncbi:MAG: DUF2007 domain-containing protein [Phycisphaerales bacterium]|jgi:hypothetical protein|nr:DUF2007 domain-containing protein [Phycisphaerales bacterium]